MDNCYLYTDHMTVGYGGKPLIRDIALRVRKGEILTLIGPNGSGKSTILKSLIRQLKLLGGTVCLDGRAMARMTEKEIATRLSVVMTERVHPELMTCRDVVSTGRYPYTDRLGLLTEADRRKVQEALALVHGEDLAEQSFTEISDGQRQRILLARALCQEPEILILDEPTSFLDIRHKLELLTILKDMVRQRQLAVVMSLHELDLAQKASDYVVCVRGSTIARYGPPEEIFTRDYVPALFGLTRGSYNADFGCLELEPVRGTPRVFVIGGGGSGIPVYRQLQRKGIPFAAGVIPENDLDHPVAVALAARVVSERPFQPIGEEAFQAAKALLETCRTVLCPLTAFGPMNERNRALRTLAEQNGTLRKEV